MCFFWFVQHFGPSKFHFCLVKWTKTAKQVSLWKKFFKMVPWDVANNRYVNRYFFFKKALKKTKTKKQKKCT